MKNYEDLAALENNASFEQDLKTASTPEEAQDVLKRYGVDMSLQEVRGLISEPVGELSDSDLESVAGGAARRIVGWRIIWKRIPPLKIPRPVLVPIYG